MLRMTADNRFRKLIIVGDRVLIRPSRPEERTNSGLYLPPGIGERDQVRQGTIIRTGPGIPVPSFSEEESWKQDAEQVRYIPLQAKEGDLAIFLMNGSTEVRYQDEVLYIVPQQSILMLEREEEL
jgi:chaperonin GroES